MEAFSLLKYWRGGGGGGAAGDSGTSLRSTATATATATAAAAATTTIVTAVTQRAAETDDDDDDGGDDGPFFDLEFAVQDEEEEEDGDRMNNGEEIENGNVGVESEHDCTVLTEEEEDDGEEREFNFTISSNSSGGNDDRTDPNLTLSPSDDLFFKGRLVPIEPSSLVFNPAEPNSKPQFPVSLLKSATKFRVFMLGFKKSKQAAASEKPEINNSSSAAAAAATTAAADGGASSKQQQQQLKPEAEKEKQNKFFTVKFKVEEVPIMSLFTRDNNGSRKALSQPQKHQNNNNVVEDSVSVSVSSDEKRFSKDVMQKYLKKVKPLYVRVSKRYGEKLKFSGQLSLNSAARSIQSPPSTAGQKPKPTAEKSQTEVTTEPAETQLKSQKLQANIPERLRVVCKQLGKSRSASSAVAAAPAGPVVQRRDDSLLQQQDNIQSAILHCKRSFNASRDSDSSILPRSISDPSSHKSTKELSRKSSDEVKD
ncbi:hypothetical protein Dsin_007782 [Dipteronia sinensis]|uniref:Membrane-associated kinase regulator 2 n=1 Tax=Dipteronia sinensis TaxID=43782 RepID=A0AAE0EIR4_9ROSI|nr:hypothetical protein Dsin_007782 [Dipteronia sinensis]